MSRKRLAFGLLLLVAACGCASHNPHCHGGQFVCEQQCDATSETSTAPYKATYILYQWRTPPKGQPSPHTWMPDHEVTELYVRGLDKGDKVGFEKGEKDELFAVAGGEKILLEPGRYCWHVSPETEMRGVRRAVHECCETIQEIVGAIIALPLGIVLLILLLPLLLLFVPFILLLGLFLLCAA